MARQPVDRVWRIRESVLSTLKHIPGRQKLQASVQKLLAEMDSAGTGNNDFSDFANGKEGTEFLAKCFLDYYRTKPEFLPDHLRAIANDEHKLFNAMFERITDSGKSYKYAWPTVNNDPVMKGLRWIIGAIAGSVLGLPEFARDLEKGRCTDLSDYLSLTSTCLGYALAKNKKLTVQEAIQVYERQIGDRAEVEALAKRITSINPDTIRYGILDGKRIGVSAVFAITDQAFEATIRGERNAYSYRDGEIVPFGRNLVLFSFADIMSEEANYTFRVRWSMSTSFISQIALLIDPNNKQPIRYVTNDIHPANTKRLQALGFSTLDCNFNPKVHSPLMILDETSSPKRTKLLLGAVKNLLVYLREQTELEREDIKLETIDKVNKK